MRRQPVLMVAALVLALPAVIMRGCEDGPQPKPIDLQAGYSPADKTVRLTWTAPEGVEPSGYQVFRQTHDWPKSLPKEPLATAIGALEWTDPEPPMGGRVDYVVKPVDAATGEPVDALAGYAVARTASDDAPPAPPVIKEAADVPYDAGGAVAVEFQSPSEDDLHGQEDVVSYSIFRSTSPPTGPTPSGERIARVPAGAMGYVDRAASDGTAYYYWVTASDGTNESVPSGIAGPAVSRANARERLWSLLRSALALAFTLGLAVTVHEYGHMQLAKLFRIRVDEFAIGFGMRVFGWKRGGTDYSVRAIPAGGFVRIRGMVPDELHDPEGFYARPALARCGVLVAGALMNVALAFIFYGAVAGAYTTGTFPIVEKVKPGGPAELAGLQRGDIIHSVNGVVYSRDLFAVGAISRSAGSPVRLEVKRGDALVPLTATPLPEDVDENIERALYGLSKTQSRGMIGVAMSPRPYEAPRASGPAEFVSSTGRFLRDDTVALLRLLRDLIFGRIGVKGTVGGPIAIVQGVHQAQVAGLQPLLALIAYLNVTLAVVNLLPFPMFDGSRVVLTLIEGLRGRLFDKEKEAMFHLAGVVLILVFVAFISWMDVGRLLGGG